MLRKFECDQCGYKVETLGRQIEHYCPKSKDLKSRYVTLRPKVGK